MEPCIDKQYVLYCAMCIGKSFAQLLTQILFRDPFFTLKKPLGPEHVSHNSLWTIYDYQAILNISCLATYCLTLAITGCFFGITMGMATIFIYSFLPQPSLRLPPRICDGKGSRFSMQSRAQILSPLTGVKIIYEVGWKSTQAWGCPYSGGHKEKSSILTDP
jgi:hypothetical protein